MMKALTVGGFLLFLAGVGLFLAQMWVHPYRPEVFIKLIVTDGVLVAVVAVLAFLIRENQQSDSIHRGSDLK